MSDNPREAVVVALFKTENEGQYSTKAMLDAVKQFNYRDKKFINELFMGVLRNKTRLDYIINAYSKIKLKRISPWILQILRTGIYQLVFMDKIPPSAVCNEAVKLATKYSHNATKGYVNGVLRAVSRTLDEIPTPNRENIIEYLSTMYSSPVWLTEELFSQYGEETCERILSDSLLPHPTMIRANLLKTDPNDLVLLLEKEGISAKISDDVSGCLIINGAFDVSASDLYKRGFYTPQNINSMRAALALKPKSGETVIDVCSAPGGKTTHIAELMGDKGHVIAFDIHSHKKLLIENTAKRLCLSSIDAIVHNSEDVKEEYIGAADRVLADVPCSGIGVIHKKPDIKWNRKAEDIDTLCKTQKKILNSAAQYVKSGGVLVYSTCTILKEENEEQIKGFLDSHNDFEADFERLYLAHETGGSGFYICRLKRK